MARRSALVQICLAMEDFANLVVVVRKLDHVRPAFGPTVRKALIKIVPRHPERVAVLLLHSAVLSVVRSVDANEATVSLTASTAQKSVRFRTCSHCAFDKQAEKPKIGSRSSGAMIWSRATRSG